MNLVVGYKNLIVNSVRDWLSADYVSHNQVFELDLKKYSKLYMFSFDPKLKIKKENNFDFEKKLFSLFEYKEIIYSSSSSIYKNKLKCCEDDTIEPETFYGENKYRIENIIKNFTQKYFIYRISNLFKYDQFTENTFFNILKKNYLRNEIIFDCNLHSIRDFITTDILSDIFSKMHYSNFYGTYNVGSMKGIKISTIIDLVLGQNHDCKISIVDKNYKNKTLSIEKILNHLNFDPNHFHFKTVEEIKKINFNS